MSDQTQPDNQKPDLRPIHSLLFVGTVHCKGRGREDEGRGPLRSPSSLSVIYL